MPWMIPTRMGGYGQLQFLMTEATEVVEAVTPEPTEEAEAVVDELTVIENPDDPGMTIQDEDGNEVIP